MPTHFENLRATLVEYQTATPLRRQQLFTKARARIEQLPQVINTKEQAIGIYQTLAETIALIEHANTLSTTEASPVQKAPSYQGIFFDEDGKTTFLKDAETSMLDDYLAEQHSSLFETAASHFNKTPIALFRQALTDCIQHDQFNSLPNVRRFKQDFINIIARHLTQSQILKALIDYIEATTLSLEGDQDTTTRQFKLLMELRCFIQQKTMKQSLLYGEAIDFIKNNSQAITVDALTEPDTIHGLYINKIALKTWFFDKGIPESPLREAQQYKTPAKAFTPLEAVASHPEHSTSRILLLLACQIEQLKPPSADWLRLFNQDAEDGRYEAAKNTLIQRIHQTLQIETTTAQKHTRELKRLIANLKARLHDGSLNKDLQKHLHSLIVEVEKEDLSIITDNTLFKALKLTESMLDIDKKFTPEEYLAYEAHAKLMKGHASSFLQTVAGILLVLGATAFALGMVSLLTPPVAIITTGTLITASAICFFNSQQSGSSQAMSELARAKQAVDREVGFNFS